jgi:hypothetical protein
MGKKDVKKNPHHLLFIGNSGTSCLIRDLTPWIAVALSSREPSEPRAPEEAILGVIVPDPWICWSLF